MVFTCGVIMNILRRDCVETWFQEAQQPAFSEAYTAGFKSFCASKYMESTFMAYFHTQIANATQLQARITSGCFCFTVS